MSHETMPAFTPGQGGLGLSEGHMIFSRAPLPRSWLEDDTGRDEVADEGRDGGAETEENGGGREAEMLCREMQEEARE